MEYAFTSIDDNKVLIDKNRGYIAFEDIVKLFGADHLAIKRDLDRRIENNRDNGIELISYQDTLYYSLDVVILSAFDYDYKIAFKLYESASRKKLTSTNYVNKIIEKEKEPLLKLDSISIKFDFEIKTMFDDDYDFLKKSGPVYSISLFFHQV